MNEHYGKGKWTRKGKQGKEYSELRKWGDRGRYLRDRLRRYNKAVRAFPREQRESGRRGRMPREPALGRNG